MSLEDYRNAVDSLEGYGGIIGMIGGEPLLHPRFPEMAAYLKEKTADKQKRGLWSTVEKEQERLTVKAREAGLRYRAFHSPENLLNILMGRPALTSPLPASLDKLAVGE
jgi:hypothetical protein